MNHQSRLRYVYTLIIVGAATLISKMLLPHFATSNLVMVYLLAVVIVATQYGKGPAILASMLSVCIFDFFCIPPYLTLAVCDSQYLLTFGVMLTIALVISNLTATAHDQAERATRKEQQTSLLYSFSRELAAGRDLAALAEIGERHITQLVEAKSEIFIADQSGNLTQSLQAKTALSQSDKDTIERSSKESPKQNFKLTQGSKIIPLRGSTSATELLGVVYVAPGLSHCDSERLSTLEAFVSQLATACERTRLSEENEQARVQVKSEQLRSSLLSSISHDLRTPLATITGAASGIMEAGSKVNLNECKELASEIFNESRRLNRLVGNLLDMTRVESGALEIHKEPQPVDEIIGAAISYFEEQLESRSIETEIPDDLPMILGDAVLIQQLLINLLENVLKYTPPDSPLLFKASCNQINNSNNGTGKKGTNGATADAMVGGGTYSKPQLVTIELSDRGPGIPDNMRTQIFQKFVRAKNRTSASGAGLGLAICQGIVEAHGGKIGVKEREGGGATFWFTLAVANTDSITQEQTKEQNAIDA